MKLKLTPIPLLLSLSLLISCKTTEENYRSAYEVTKARQTQGLTDREIAAMQREESLPKVVYKGDSIPLKSVYVKWVEGGAGGTALRYNVVINSFKQQFNARSVLTRLRDAGYATPLLLEDKTGRYYVAASTTASLDTALTTLRSLEQTSPVPLRPPYPYILQRP